LERAGPSIESEHVICQSYRLGSFEIRDSAASGALSVGDELWTELSVESALERRDFLCCEVADLALVEWVLDAVGLILFAWPA
jgi:hypothetical protein